MKKTNWPLLILCLSAGTHLMTGCGPNGIPYRKARLPQEKPPLDEDYPNYEDQPIEASDLDGAWKYSMAKRPNTVDTVSKRVEGELILDLDRGIYTRTETFFDEETAGKETQTRSQSGKIMFKPIGDILKITVDKTVPGTFIELHQEAIAEAYTKKRFCGRKIWRVGIMVYGEDMTCASTIDLPKFIHVDRLKGDELVLSFCVAPRQARTSEHDCEKMKFKR